MANSEKGMGKALENPDDSKGQGKALENPNDEPTKPGLDSIDQPGWTLEEFEAWEPSEEDEVVEEREIATPKSVKALALAKGIFFLDAPELALKQFPASTPTQAAVANPLDSTADVGPAPRSPPGTGPRQVLPEKPAEPAVPRRRQEGDDSHTPKQEEAASASDTVGRVAESPAPAPGPFTALYDRIVAGDINHGLVNPMAPPTSTGARVGAALAVAGDTSSKVPEPVTQGVKVTPIVSAPVVTVAPPSPPKPVMAAPSPVLAVSAGSTASASASTQPATNAGAVMPLPGLTASATKASDKPAVSGPSGPVAAPVVAAVQPIAGPSVTVPVPAPSPAVPPSGQSVAPVMPIIPQPVVQALPPQVYFPVVLPPAPVQQPVIQLPPVQKAVSVEVFMPDAPAYVPVAVEEAVSVELSMADDAYDVEVTMTDAPVYVPSFGQLYVAPLHVQHKQLLKKLFAHRRGKGNRQKRMTIDFSLNPSFSHKKYGQARVIIDRPQMMYQVRK
ncbi:hypothetical protein ABW19_dt0205317 [Dactylella cylindrospora]|nr:hypothetical protein ABW19_dt0205317 [Dactylella cylindrospora]